MKYILLFTALLFVSITHSQTTTKITDEEIYEVINQLIPDSSILINQFKLFDDTDKIRRVIERYPNHFKSEDKEYMYAQVYNKEHRIKKKFIEGKGKRLFSDKKIRRFFWFVNRKDRGNLDRRWDKFHKKYGKGFYRISRPIFSKDKSVIIISEGFYCGGLCGSGGIYIYKKINGKWEMEEMYSLWVS